jgi:hypothetical protein
VTRDELLSSDSARQAFLRCTLATHRIRAHTLGMARCRARTKKGTGPLCTHKVKKDGLRCWQHEGLPTAPPRMSKPSARRKSGKRRSGISGSAHLREQERRRAAAKAARIEEKKRERVKKAASYCSDVLNDGWVDAVAERATDYVTDETWYRVFRSRGSQCRMLARIAQRILAAKDQLHNWLGDFLAWLLSLVNVGTTAREFAGELAANIPIPPIDLKMVAVARGVQVAGIVVCVSRGEDLTKCQCFVDLALVETKTKVKKILVAAMGDWTRLAYLTPKEQHRAA